MGVGMARAAVANAACCVVCLDTTLICYLPAAHHRARDFQPNWMSSVAVLDDDTYLGEFLRCLGALVACVALHLAYSAHRR